MPPLKTIMQGESSNHYLYSAKKMFDKIQHTEPTKLTADPVVQLLLHGFF